jgi:hypothetical protein
MLFGGMMMANMTIVLLLFALNIQPLIFKPAPQAFDHLKDVNRGQNSLLSAEFFQPRFAYPHQPDSSQENTRPPNDNERWARRGFYVNGFLALATLVLAVFAVVQANAAKASVKAIIAENRPWVLISRDAAQDDIQHPYLIPKHKAPPSELLSSHCIYSIRNYGKTPARIFALKAELRIGNSQTVPPSTDGDVSREPSRHAYIFPQGESELREARLMPDGIISADDEMEIMMRQNGSKFVWLIGCIKYHDTFNHAKPVEYETRFCYVFGTWLKPSERNWFPAGPPEYNKAT